MCNIWANFFPSNFNFDLFERETESLRLLVPFMNAHDSLRLGSKLETEGSTQVSHTGSSNSSPGAILAASQSSHWEEAEISWGWKSNTGSLMWNTGVLTKLGTPPPAESIANPF